MQSPMPHTAIDPANRESRQSRLAHGGLIQGVDLWPLTRHEDDRGSFMEVFQEHWGSAIKPVQWSAVGSEPRVFRGMHLHWRHDEYIMVVSGHASVGLRDARPESPTFGVWSLYELYGEQPAALTFPQGIIHGWYTHEPTLHLQAVSEAYVDYHPEDNIGVRFDDPDLGIPWSDPDPILSERA
ncbi:MAG: dTDP-4-dehydrorhamnose 3,5-epimerase family protein, partial [Rhodothermales bacterium]|nr:dTDP-4-dehydrorhamnose 3,5-epimerase family protein [Rhodothermales bacterium]